MDIHAVKVAESERKMGDCEKWIIGLLKHTPGLSDGELTEAISGHGASLKNINKNCRTLETEGMILRKKRDDGLIGNWLLESNHTHQILQQIKLHNKDEDISEKKIKEILNIYLTSAGWTTETSLSAGHGIDIEASRGNDRWVIQVKGTSAFRSMIVNNFLSALGEIFQRMDDSKCKYSVALPDTEQFGRLWERLPLLAKTKIGITALFVNGLGKVTERT